MLEHLRENYFQMICKISKNSPPKEPHLHCAPPNNHTSVHIFQFLPVSCSIRRHGFPPVSSTLRLMQKVHPEFSLWYFQLDSCLTVFLVIWHSPSLCWNHYPWHLSFTPLIGLFCPKMLLNCLFPTTTTAFITASSKYYQNIHLSKKHFLKDTAFFSLWSPLTSSFTHHFLSLYICFSISSLLLSLTLPLHLSILSSPISTPLNFEIGWEAASFLLRVISIFLLIIW